MKQLAKPRMAARMAATWLSRSIFWESDNNEFMSSGQPLHLGFTIERTAVFYARFFWGLVWCGAEMKEPVEYVRSTRILRTNRKLNCTRHCCRLGGGLMAVWRADQMLDWIRTKDLKSFDPNVLHIRRCEVCQPSSYKPNLLVASRLTNEL